MTNTMDTELGFDAAQEMHFARMEPEHADILRGNIRWARQHARRDPSLHVVEDPTRLPTEIEHHFEGERQPMHAIAELATTAEPRFPDIVAAYQAAEAEHGLLSQVKDATKAGYTVVTIDLHTDLTSIAINQAGVVVGLGEEKMADIRTGIVMSHMIPSVEFERELAGPDGETVPFRIPALPALRTGENDVILSFPRGRSVNAHFPNMNGTIDAWNLRAAGSLNDVLNSGGYIFTMGPSGGTPRQNEQDPSGPLLIPRASEGTKNALTHPKVLVLSTALDLTNPNHLGVEVPPSLIAFSDKDAVEDHIQQLALRTNAVMAGTGKTYWYGAIN